MKKVWMATALALMVFTGCNFSFQPNKKTVYCRGEVVDKDMGLTGFDRIEINGSADLNYVRADENGVKVTANEDVFQYLNFHVEDGVLYLENIDSVQIRAEKFEIYVTGSALKNMTVNGATDASIVAIDSDEELAITVNGAGDIELENIKVPTLTCMVNGAGDLKASGLKVGNLNVTINGAGDMTFAGEAEHALLKVSGAGDIDVRALVCPNIETVKSGLARIRTQ